MVIGSRVRCRGRGHTTSGTGTSTEVGKLNYVINCLLFWVMDNGDASSTSFFVRFQSTSVMQESSSRGYRMELGNTRLRTGASTDSQSKIIFPELFRDIDRNFLTLLLADILGNGRAVCAMARWVLQRVRYSETCLVGCSHIINQPS